MSYFWIFLQTSCLLWTLNHLAIHLIASNTEAGSCMSQILNSTSRYPIWWKANLNSMFILENFFNAPLIPLLTQVCIFRFQGSTEKVLKWTVTLFTTRWQKVNMDCQEVADYTGRLAGCLCDQRASPGHLPHPLKTFYSHHHHRHRHSPYQLPLSNFNNRSWSKQTFTGLKHTCRVYYQKFPWKRAFYGLFYNDSFGYLSFINHENYTNILNMDFLGKFVLWIPFEIHKLYKKC